MARPPKSLLKDSHPELAEQLVDKSLLPTLSTGSDLSLEWECEFGHRWFAKPYNRTNARHPSGCPVCAGKSILIGFNDLATTDPDVAALLYDPDMATKVSRSSNRKMKWTCDKGHVWTAPVSRLTFQGSRCPYCSGRYAEPGVNDLATVRPDLAAELVDQSLATKLKAGSSVVQWKCHVCGYVWTGNVWGRIKRNNGCPRCAGRVIIPGDNDLATFAPDYAATLANPDDAKTVGKASDTKLEWVCQAHPDHRWFATPANRMKSPVDKGCPICANKAVKVGFNDLATTHPDLVSELVDKTLAISLTAGSTKRVEWQCSLGHRWFAQVSHRSGENGTGCPVCNPTGTSIMERELLACVMKLLPDTEILHNDHGLLSGRRELDIVVPSCKVAIEFNGVRWHSEAVNKSRNYHKDKSDECKALGYQLVHVWEDDWVSRKSVVIRMIAAKLGVTYRLNDAFPEMDPRCSERVYARKLQFCEISGHVAAEFLEENHIQGPVSATRHFALKDSDNVVRAVMSVRSPRSNARMKRKVGDWEIQRYATFGSVVSGFTKLMKHAEATIIAEGNSLERWISFSSNDISDGNMYRRCGFVIDGDVAPDYKYVGNAIGWYRQPKEKFQKRRFRDDPNLLWDESWTERKAAEENGLFRCWDSGKIRWVRDVHSTTSCERSVVDENAVVVNSDADVKVEAAPIARDIKVRRRSEVKKAKPGPKVKDLTGKTFGYWTVLKRSEDKVDANGRHFNMWTCRCACGTVRDVMGSSLCRGVSTSCGCMHSVSGKAVNDTGDGRHPVNPISEELCQEMVDASYRGLSAMSHKKIEWRCEQGHVWSASVSSRSQGSGCPYCSGRIPVCGVNDLATTHPDLARQLLDPEQGKLVGAGSSKKLEWVCDKNPEHVWTAAVRNRVGFNGKASTGCPVCSGRKRV